jgi:hypothetical protein
MRSYTHYAEMGFTGLATSAKKVSHPLLAASGEPGANVPASFRLTMCTIACNVLRFLRKIPTNRCGGAGSLFHLLSYSRAAAVDYAEKNWKTNCHDGVISIIGSPGELFDLVLSG